MLPLLLQALLACDTAGVLDWIPEADTGEAADSAAPDGGDTSPPEDSDPPPEDSDPPPEDTDPPPEDTAPPWEDTDVESLPDAPDAPDETDILFDDEVIEIQIELSEASYQDLVAQSQEAQRYGAEYVDFEYVEATVIFEGVEYSPVGVRIKGQGSFQPIWVKPSLKIKFDLYDEDLRFIGGLNRLTLNNMTNDYTMMHERMAYRLYREAEVPASRAGHAVLTINDEPYGLYTSLETVDSDMIRRWYSDEGVLYEGWDCDLKDAYIDNFELEFGDDEVGRAQLAAAANALEFVNGDAALEAVGEYVDWEQFVRFWAAEAVMGQFDSYPYSSPGDDYFLYLDPDDGLFDYLPWGNDETFSSPTYTVTYSTGIMGQVCNQSSSCQALFREQVWDILTIAEDYDWLAYHDEIAAQIQPYVEADDHKVYSDMTVSTYQSSMRDFVNSRESRLEQMLGPRP